MGHGKITVFSFSISSKVSILENEQNEDFGHKIIKSVKKVYKNDIKSWMYKIVIRWNAARFKKSISPLNESLAKTSKRS